MYPIAKIRSKSCDVVDDPTVHCGFHYYFARVIQAFPLTFVSDSLIVCRSRKNRSHRRIIIYLVWGLPFVDILEERKWGGMVRDNHRGMLKLCIQYISWSLDHLHAICDPIYFVDHLHAIWKHSHSWELYLFPYLVLRSLSELFLWSGYHQVHPYEMIYCPIKLWKGCDEIILLYRDVVGVKCHNIWVLKTFHYSPQECA